MQGGADGYEAQVDNTNQASRTGSLTFFHNISDTLAEDNKWFQLHIVAVGNRIVIKVDNRIAVDYVDKANTYRFGSVGLSIWGKDSIVMYKNIVVKPLPADERAATHDAMYEMPGLTFDKPK